MDGLGAAAGLRQDDGDATIGENVRAVAAAGGALSSADRVAAVSEGRAIRREASAIFVDQQMDLLMCPATAALAWPADQPFPPIIESRDAGPRGHAVFTAWMNVAGLAAGTIPLTSAAGEGGIGIHVVAPVQHDLDLLGFLNALSLPDQFKETSAWSCRGLVPLL